MVNLKWSWFVRLVLTKKNNTMKNILFALVLGCLVFGFGCSKVEVEKVVTDTETQAVEGDNAAPAE